MASNGKFHTALPSHVSKVLICDLFGAFQDYYILQSRALNSPFERFDTRNVPEIFIDSDDEEDA